MPSDRNVSPQPEPNPEPNDNAWDVFLPDDEPAEPVPEPGDFWIDCDEAIAARAAA